MSCGPFSPRQIKRASICGQWCCATTESRAQFQRSSTRPMLATRLLSPIITTGQSLVQTLLANGVGHVALTDWKSATGDMKDLEIDNYLAEVVVAIDDLGGRVNLVGLCQGGWVAAMIAARFPKKVNSLVLAGAPIDTDAGDGPIKRMAHKSPISFYKELVALGGGLMKGKFMLQGWKNMNPEQHYFQDHIDLYEHIDDPAYLAKEETFYQMV